jgi:uncharacterized protein
MQEREMSKPKFNWISKRKKTDVEVPFEPPIWLGNMSNGEFFKEAGKRERKLRELILQRCDDNARRLNMDRREFIASTMGMATTLSCLNLAAGCGGKDGMMSTGVLDRMMSEAGKGAYGGSMGQSGSGGSPATPSASGGRSAAGAAGRPSSGGAGAGGSGVADAGPAGQMPPSMNGGSDGGFVVTQEMCMNPALADRLLKQEYFILDFQTHHTNDDQNGPCFTDMCNMDGTHPDVYVRDIFEMSETTVAVLSGLPSQIDEMTNDLSPFSFTNADMRASRDRVNMAAKPTPEAGERMIAHCQISPKNNPEANARMMAENKMMYDTRGWKCYPPTEGGWFLHENDAFIKTGIELGEPLVCAHKGFPFPGWSVVHADPGPDVAVVAKRYPEVTFVIYHSAYDNSHTEGPYNANPDPMHGGTDRLAKVVSENGLTSMNVYAEMGSAWALVMSDPMAAQHYVGKMLKYVGPERMVWGSECVWFGSPQNQIEAMKLFRISQEFQDMYGYPEFSDDLKRKLFGLTGARLYRVDPNLCRYKVGLSDLAKRRQYLDDRLGDRRHAVSKPFVQTRRQFIDIWKRRIARGEIA